MRAPFLLLTMALFPACNRSGLPERSDAEPASATSGPLSQPPALVDVAGIKTGVAADWAAYDALPNKTKEALVATTQSARAKALQLRDPESSLAQFAIEATGRERMAPLIQSEARATGEGREVLIPSQNAAKCRLWASTWAGDDETIKSLRSLGFKQLACADKSWDLEEASRTCFLYWVGNDDPVFVWKSVAYFQKGQQVGKETGQRAAMKMLALVSDGATSMMPGGHFVITDAGDDWLHITGRGTQSGISGYVESITCQRKPYHGAVVPESAAMLPAPRKSTPHTAPSPDVGPSTSSSSSSPASSNTVAPTPATVSESAPGFLSLDTYPATVVSEGGQVLGTTPLVRFSLAPGLHTLTLVSESAGISQSFAVTIVSGGTVSRRLGLK